jgi:hypothetical protein
MRCSVEGSFGISLRWLKQRYGDLSQMAAGTFLTITWSRRGEKCGSAGLRADGWPWFSLHYFHKANDYEEYKPKHVTIKVDSTPCNYGGWRHWFLCPSCGRRVDRLFVCGVTGCRHCLRLCYQVENEGQLDRARRRREKLGARLKVSDDFLGWIYRPKGMHRDTFERLCDMYEDAQSAEDAAFISRVQSIVRGRS